jgi:S1-C subfamily serine protease
MATKIIRPAVRRTLLAATAAILAVAVAAPSSVAPALAQTQTQPQTQAEPPVQSQPQPQAQLQPLRQGQGPASVADLAEGLLGAVVNISTSQNVKGAEGPDAVPMPELPEGSPFQDFFDDFFKDRGGPGGRPQRVQSLGSGFVVDAEKGIVITNNHVISDADEIEVNFSDGSTLKAELVGTDPLSDLAVIKLVGASGLAPIEFADSDELNVGDSAIAIGAPLGLSGTVTNGIVSALYRSIDVQSAAAPETPGDGSEEEGEGDQGQRPFDFWNFDVPGQQGRSEGSGLISIPVIQTDAAINPGNSGGALLDADGRLIGINVAILSAGGVSVEAGNIGVGFAVPSNLAERVAN